MRALVAAPPAGVELVELTTPANDVGTILVAPRLVGLCGTDLELIDGTMDPAYVHYPLVLGHEWVGELVEDVADIGPAGSHVVVEGIVPCGVCAACRRGDTNRCETYDEIGFTRPGALADLVAVPRALVHRVNDTVALEDAVLVEPMAVVWRALTRLPLGVSPRVAVIGDGTVALLAAHLVRLFEPADVTVIGRREAQAGLARAAGADRFVTATPTESFDVVIEAAGVTEATATALQVAARGATVILLGLPPHGSTVAVAPDDLVNNDVIVQGSFSYTQRAWSEVVTRLNDGALHPSFLVTHRFALEDFADAITALRGVGSSTAPRGKVVIRVEAP